jgi:hypothetical protein
MKYSKHLSKNTKNGNQALTNVPLAKKKLNPKIKKLLLCRAPGGALGKGACAEGGPSAQRCTLPTATGSSRQRAVNHGKPWSMALPRAKLRYSAHVASVPTAQRQSRRHNGRQPKCNDARSFSDGAFRAERWPSARTSLCRGSQPADGPTLGKGGNSVSIVVPSAALSKDFLCRGPEKLGKDINPRQSLSFL